LQLWLQEYARNIQIWMFVI